MTATERDGALAGLRVVELVDEPVEYCGRLLAGLGADVDQARTRRGCAQPRTSGPYVDGRDGDPDASLNFWHFNVGKRSAVVPDDDDDPPRSARPPTSSSTRSARPRRPSTRARPRVAGRGRSRRIVSCAITPFGLTGPWADYVADDLVLMALGGSMAACGYGTDDPPLACFGATRRG